MLICVICELSSSVENSFSGYAHMSHIVLLALGVDPEHRWIDFVCEAISRLLVPCAGHRIIELNLVLIILLSLSSFYLSDRTHHS